MKSAVPSWKLEVENKQGCRSQHKAKLSEGTLLNPDIQQIILFFPCLDFLLTFRSSIEAGVMSRRLEMHEHTHSRPEWNQIDLKLSWSICCRFANRLLIDVLLALFSLCFNIKGFHLTLLDDECEFSSAF